MNNQTNPTIRALRRSYGAFAALALFLLSGCSSDEPIPSAPPVDDTAQARRAAQQAADRKREREEAARDAQALLEVRKATERIYQEGERTRLALEDLKAQHERAQAGLRAMYRERQSAKAAHERAEALGRREIQETNRLLGVNDGTRSGGKTRR